MKMKQILAVIVATALFLVTAYLGVQSATAVNDAAFYATSSISELSTLFNSFDASDATEDFDFPADPFLARIDVTGTIGPSYYDPLNPSTGYDHDLYMDLVDALIDDPDNAGIILYVDTPGGTVYEADEFYLKLMEYRETTQRPIYAYFATEACSGGYYIAMAANEIYANRNAWTGSIGVIISLLNYQGLAEKIGVTEIDITTGRNKSMGSAWETLTDEQRAILQSLVDESYAQFVDIVATGRGMTAERVRELADGRIYSAKQALALDMIDEIAGEEDAISAFYEKAGVDPSIDLYIPDRSYSLNWFSYLFSTAAAVRPKSELELFRELVDNPRNGVLRYEVR